MRLLFFIAVIIVFLSGNSCNTSEIKENEKYYTKEWIYNSKEKLDRAEYFVQKYSDHWLDTTSSYYKSCSKFSFWTDPDSIFLFAVLPSYSWDTVLFYPIWKVTYIDNSYSVTGMPICARFTDTNIVFLKPKMLFEITEENNAGSFDKIKDRFKTLLQKSHYLNSDNSVDPTYWFRFITDDGFFFDDYEENAKKSAILQKSRKDYFDYLLIPYKKNNMGGADNDPVPKPDYSDWEPEIHHDWKDSTRLEPH